ncbi:MAG: hypothetical protein AAGF74_16835 [Pseudomonadota bacterium]
MRAEATRSVVLAASVLLAASAAHAQPLSAIDWLNQAVTNPAPHSEPLRDLTPPKIDVRPIRPPTVDAAGLLSPFVTGLPREMWTASDVGTVVNLIESEDSGGLPAIREILMTVLLAEAIPPRGAGDGRFLEARVDKLVDLGALEAAAGLLEQTPLSDPALFAQWFDVRLLLGTESEVCDRMLARPNLAPDYESRVFCLARAGDWSAAAISLDAGAALGSVTPERAQLLDRFLDDVEDGGLLPAPTTGAVTPLTFRLLEAIGEPLGSSGLPRAYAYADLSPNSGWRAQLAAAERLGGERAIAPSVVFGIYSAGRPSASGGVWDRVAAIQALDKALSETDAAAVAEALPHAWEAMEQAELEVPFARYYAQALLALPLPDDAAELAARIALLSESAELAARRLRASEGEAAFLAALALGDPTPAQAVTPEQSIVKAAYSSDALSASYAMMLERGRTGEAILVAARLLVDGSRGDLQDVAVALRLFRQVGLEEIAREAALQFLILERRG